MGAEDTLVEFLDRGSSTSLPADATEKVALCLLDAASLAVAAREHPVTSAVRGLFEPHPEPSSRRARLWTSSSAYVGVLDACFANAVAAHAHFQDDTDMVAWAHPGSLITPVPAALAEARSLPPERVLAGIAAGYATLSWLAAEEEVARAIVDRGFRAGPTLGVVAAAAAGAVTLGLPPERALWALGIAADSAGALLEPVRAGAQDWRLQNATAAMRGAQAALLAEAGVVGPPQPLTGGRGLLASFTGSTSIPRRWSSAPSYDDVDRVWFKAFPTLGDNMAVAIAAHRLHHDVLASHPGRNVGAVTVGMNAHFAAYPGTSFAGPFTTVDQAIASTRFAVATLLLRGELRYRDYPGLMADDKILGLVPQIVVEPHADLDYVSGWVRADVDGEAVTRSAADAPRELFFRNRQTALDAALDATGAGARPGVERFFSWLDGDAAADPVGDLVTALQDASADR